MSKKPALGRGLSALLENAKTDITTKQAGDGAPVVNSVSVIKLSNIEVNPFQPRTNFEESALQELSDSIKQHGIIQPLTLRKLGYDKYQLISGERRLTEMKNNKLPVLLEKGIYFVKIGEGVLEKLEKIIVW